MVSSSLIGGAVDIIGGPVAQRTKTNSFPMFTVSSNDECTDWLRGLMFEYWHSLSCKLFSPFY